MKHLIGTPVNIKEDVLGRITLKSKNVFSRKDNILVADNLTSVPSGYAAVITNVQVSGNGCACIVDNGQMCEFKEGDVV